MPSIVTWKLRMAILSPSHRQRQRGKHGVPGPFVARRPFRPERLTGGLRPVHDGHLRAALPGRERDLALRRLVRAGRDEEVEKDAVRKIPGPNMAKLDLAPITRAFVEPSTL